MTLSPTERRELLELTAKLLTQQLRESIDIDEINTLDLATAGQLIGLGPKAAATHLPVIEVGPRTRRVTVKALKEFIASRTVQPSRK